MDIGVKKKDGILIGIVLILAIVMALVMYGKGGAVGDIVHIRIDGELYGTYSLMMNQEIQIENAHGYNCILIEQGRVSMKEADCPDGYCVAHKAITQTNETIVCLPHKLVVELDRKIEDGIDSVTQ